MLDLDIVDFPEPVKDEHSDGKMFCWNPACSCHEDDMLIKQVFWFWQEGLMTAHEARDFVAGKGI